MNLGVEVVVPFSSRSLALNERERKKEPQISSKPISIATVLVQPYFCCKLFCVILIREERICLRGHP